MPRLARLRCGTFGDDDRRTPFGAETLGRIAFSSRYFEDSKRIDQRQVVARFRLPIRVEDSDFMSRDVHHGFLEVLQQVGIDTAYQDAETVEGDDDPRDDSRGDIRVVEQGRCPDG